MTSFDNTHSWTDYRDILAAEFEIVLTIEPHEFWREVRGHKVRIDEWTADRPAKGTLILVHGGGGNGRILAPSLNRSRARVGACLRQTCRAMA